MTYGVMLGVKPTSGSAPLTVHVSGGVYVVETGQPVYAVVYIYRNDVLIADLMSSGLYGTFEMDDTLTEAGTYKYQAKSCLVLSNVVTVTVSAPPVTKKGTSLSMVGNPLSGNAPLKVSLWATLKDEAGGGVGGKQVLVYMNDQLVFSQTTDTGGKISGSVDITEKGTYSLQAKFLGDDRYYASSSNIVTVNVTEILSTSISIVVNPVSGITPLTIRVTGTLYDEAMAGIPTKSVDVYVDDLKVGSTTTFPQTQVLSAGDFDFSTTITAVGSHSVQAKFRGNAIYNACSSNIVSVTVEEKTIPVVPEGATHALKVGYYNLAGLTKEALAEAVRSLVVPAVNGIICPFGYDYLDIECYSEYGAQWQVGYFYIYYKARGTPAIPVALILETIIVLIVGIVVFYCAFVILEVKKIEAEEKKSLDDLLKGGYITQEQWEKLRGAEAKPDIWTQIMSFLPYLLLFLIVASIAGALPRGRREDQNEERTSFPYKRLP